MRKTRAEGSCRQGYLRGGAFKRSWQSVGMNLSADERLNSRDHNNFNLIRLLAAAGVIITHSYALLGFPEIDLLKKISLGLISFSKLGVYLFFVISGYLVTRSLGNSSSVKSFFWKRLLRIFPALVTVILLGAFVLGPVFTELPLRLYFVSFELYRYLGGIFLYFISYTLPGVFLHNPYPAAINGSLWTLPYEWTCYLLVACLVPLVKHKNYQALGLAAIGAMIIRTLVGNIQYGLVIPLINVDTRQLLLYLFLFLLSGALAQAGNKIKYSGLAALGLLAVLVGLVLSNLKLANYWLLIILPYVTVWLASVPIKAGIQKLFNQADFSYGLYIYAFPVAQILIYLYPRFSPNSLALATLIGTLPLAAASWYLIEKPMLRLKFKKNVSW